MKKNNRNYLKRFLILTVSSSALMSAGAAFAQESRIDVGLTADANYTDNRFMSVDNKQSVYLFNIRPTVSFIIEGEGGTTSITCRGAYALSSDQAVEEDRFTYGGGINGNYNFEYSTLNIGAGFDRQSIFETEVDDTGQFLANQTRDRGYAEFEYATQLSETWTFRVFDTFQTNSYSNAFLNDYWSNNAGIGIDIELNETTSLVQNGSYLRYEPENVLAPSRDSYSYLAGFSHQLSQGTTVTLTGGATYLEDTFRWSAVAEIEHELENNQFTVRAAREIVPTGIGGLMQSDSVAFGSTFNYSQNSSMGVTASWRKNEGLNNLVAINNEFFSVSPWVTIEVLRNLSLRLSYQLRRQRIGLTNDWGVSNGFTIAIQY